MVRRYGRDLGKVKLASCDAPSAPEDSVNKGDSLSWKETWLRICKRKQVQQMTKLVILLLYKKDDTSFTTRFRVGGRVSCNFALYPLSSVLPACNYSECRLRWIYSTKENSNFSTLRNFLLSFFGEFAIRPPVRLLHLCTYLWVFEEEQIAASFRKRAITASLIRISANLRSNASHYWSICNILRFLFNYKLQSCRLLYVAHRRGSR